MLNIKTYNFNSFSERGILMWTEDSSDAVIVDPGCCTPEEMAEITSTIEDNKLVVKAIWLTHAHFDHIYGVSELQKKYNVPVYLNPEEKFTLETNPSLCQYVGMPVPNSDFTFEPIVEGDVLTISGEVIKGASLDSGTTAAPDSGAASSLESSATGHPCADANPAPSANTPPQPSATEPIPAHSFRVIGLPGHTPGGVGFYDEGDKLLISGDTLFGGSIGRTDLPRGDYDQLIVAIMEKLMFLDGDTEVIPGHGHITSIGYERTSNPFLQPFNEPDDPDLIIPED